MRTGPLNTRLNIRLLFSIIAVTFLFSSSPLPAINYAAQLSYIEKNTKDLYGKKSIVVQGLDEGLLSFYTGDYASSIKKLTRTESKIDDYFAKSISQSIESFIVNDLVIDYAGEDYEDLYLNLFKSLSYYHLGMLEDALVEINRFENKSQHISQRYEADLIKARQAAENADATPVSVTFHNSALGQYLALLYHRADGDKDAALSDAHFLHDAFITQSKLYNFAEPVKLVMEDLNVPKGKARINALAFSNGSPYKTQMYFPAILFNAVVAIPFMQTRRPKVSFVGVKATNCKTKQTYKSSMSQIESLENVALDTFQTHSASIYSKAIARMLFKQLSADISRGVGEVMMQSDEPAVAIIGGVLQAFSVAGEISAWLTETADLRMSSYFPARADIGGLTVDPGTYDITMEFYQEKGGKLMYRKKFKNVKVQAGKLCLLDATYLGNDVVNRQ
ncbi:MAG: hypothetical protein J6Y13_05530 [Treponema sp.]|nr:hypothetical protein [Treponema sp.]